MVRFPGRGGEALPTEIADEGSFSSATNTLNHFRDRESKGRMPLTASYNEEKAHNC